MTPFRSLPVVKLSLSKEEWIGVLTLASKWHFFCVREIAKTALEHLGLTSIEKIFLGRSDYITSWVIDGMVELVHAKTITDEEALKIDTGSNAMTTTAYKLFRIREMRIAGELGCARTMVEETFKEQLDHLRIWEKFIFRTNLKQAKKKIISRKRK